MHRRSLITGASALATFSWMRRAMGAATDACTPVASAQAVRRSLVQVCVGNSGFPLPDDFMNDTTSNSLNSRKICYAPTLSEITDIVLGYAGFGINAPEQDLPVNYTVKASVEYPLGTVPRQVFFGGLPAATVNAGRGMVRTDPLPITIPAGAKVAVKTYATWTAGNFWLTTWSAAQMIGAWTTRGTSLVDHTLDNAAQSTTSGQGGFGPIVYGTLNTAIASVAMIGDSWGSLTGDWADPSTGCNGWGRAMRGAIPFINLSKGGDSGTNYFNRPEGRNLVLRNGITHCIWEMGGNDLFAGNSIATMIGYLQTAINPFLDRGVKCFATTLTPRSTSTDGWLTTRNQKPTSLAIENVRIPYNTWLRSNWASIGLSGLFDPARAVDPGDAGIWGADAGATLAIPFPCSGFATLSNGAVASVANATYNGNSSAGGPYPTGSQVFPCTVYTYPNTSGSGAVVNAVTDPTYPWISSYTVVSGGSGYKYPPMISTKGTWTTDGMHPNSRGWNEVLKVCGNIAPETFVL